MAVGFTPSYNENITTSDLSKKEALALVFETIKKLDWAIVHASANGIIAHTNKGMFSWNAEIKITIEEDTLTVKSDSTGSELFDMGKNKKTVQHFIKAYLEVKTQFTKEELAQKFTEIENNLVAEEEDVLKLPPATTKEKIGSFFAIFKPVEGYFITPILINLNILVFIIMVCSGVNAFEPTTEDLISWGANFRPATLDGQWWRLLTNCFLHIGVFHLLMNMYALIYIGILLEPHLGKFKFLSAYLITGLVASVTSLWWHDLTVSAGASGAIFGMYGVFLVLLSTDLIEKETRKALLTSITIFVGYNLIYGLKGGIDNAAHIGGLIAGLIIGYAYTFNLDEDDEPNLKYKIVGSLTVAFAIVSSIVCSGLTNDILVYETKMKDFVDMEKMAMEVYNRINTESKEQLLYDIKDRGIYYWNENINLIDEVDKLNLPEEVHQRNAKIKLYCELRIKSYQLLYKAVSENTDKYKMEVQNYDKQIQAIVDDLKTNN